MRKLILASFFLLLPAMIFPQTQQGYVKTKGRRGSNGSVVTGTRLSEAIVQVKGRSAVKSQYDGSFSFPVPAQNFYLQSVHKEGYELTDPDLLSKQYVYSANPLVIVLETTDKMKEDRQHAASEVRSSLYARYLSKDAELKRQLNENKILQSEYDRQKALLDSLQNSNEKLVEEMAIRYSKIDYDQLDEFNRKLSEYIIIGQLTRADSLLRSKGSIEQRIETVKHYERINKKEAESINKRQSNLAASRQYVEKELESIAQDCFSYFELAKLQQQYDSAAYYIELRAALDTTDVIRQLDAGSFLKEYVYPGIYVTSPVYDKIMDYYDRALFYAIQKYGEKSPLAGTCYSHLGDMTDVYVDPRTDSLENYAKATEIMAYNFGENSIEVAECLRKMGKVYSEQFNYITRFNPFSDKAEDCAKKAYDIYLGKYGEKHYLTALCCAELGDSKYFHDDAFPYYQKALDILDALGDEHLAIKAEILTHLANHFYDGVEKGRSADVQSEMLYEKDLLGKDTDDNGHYTTKDFSDEDWHNFEALQETRIEMSQEHKENYLKARSNYEKAFQIMVSLYGDHYPKAVFLHEMIDEMTNNISIEESIIADAETEQGKYKPKSVVRLNFSHF